jgi:4-hydroxybenzoate polyprenyltransferase
MWPTLCALLLAQRGWPSWRLLFVFVTGTVCMRVAGCLVNDLCDRSFDSKVERTQHRPLATGELTPKQAIPMLLFFLILAAGLVMMTNVFTRQLAFVALALAAIYPLGKRWFPYPQLILGMAFAWAIPMAWAATMNAVEPATWIFFVAVVAWVFGYDTFYGMVDAKDDATLGLRSSALSMGQYARLGIGLTYAIALIGWGVVGYLLSLSVAYFVGLSLVAMHMGWQLYTTRPPNHARYFVAFLSNQWLGLILTLSICAGLWLP